MIGRGYSIAQSAISGFQRRKIWMRMNEELIEHVHTAWKCFSLSEGTCIAVKKGTREEPERSDNIHEGRPLC